MYRYACHRFALICIVIFGLADVAQAQVPPVFQNHLRIAASGSDVVAYFTKGQPTQGSDAFVAEHAGATWRFATAEHRDLFLAQPNKFAPQYGGYCAYAVSQGAVAKTVPEAWSIVDGKLYLNYSLGVRTRWEADKHRYIEQATTNWPGVLQ